jgi:hypothetical protein
MDYMYDDDIDVSYEGLLRLAARIGDAKPKHLPNEFKASLPRGVYKDCQPAQIEKQCAICLDTYKDSDEVLGITECAHYFHAACFETWLDLASNCPVCRRDLTPEDYRWEPPAPSSPNTSAGLHYDYASFLDTPTFADDYLGRPNESESSTENTVRVFD